MAFDLQVYRDQYKDYYRDASLDDVAKEIYTREGHAQQFPDFNEFKKAAGVDAAIEEERRRKNPSFTEKLQDAVAKITPAGFEDISTGFVKGLTWGYAPAVKTPEDAGVVHKMATGAAQLAGMGVGLIPAAKGLTLAGIAGEGLFGAIRGGLALGGIYGGLRKPEEGEGRIQNALIDAAMFGAFRAGDNLVERALGKLMPETVAPVLEKITKNAEAIKNKTPELINPLSEGEELIRKRLGYVTSGALGLGAGATEPANTWNERLQHMLIGMGTFAGAHGVMSNLPDIRSAEEKANHKNFYNYLESVHRVSEITKEGLSTGKYNGEDFTPDHAIAIIKEGLGDGYFTENHIDKFKEQYPQLRDGLNSLIAERKAAAVNTQLSEGEKYAKRWEESVARREGRSATPVKGEDAGWDSDVSQILPGHAEQVKSLGQSLLGKPDTNPSLKEHIQSADPGQGIIHSEDLYYHPAYRAALEFGKSRGFDNIIPVKDTSGSFDAVISADGKTAYLNLDDKSRSSYIKALAHERSHQSGNEETQAKIDTSSEAFKTYRATLNEPFKNKETVTVEMAKAEYAADLEAGHKNRLGAILDEGLMKDVSRETIPDYSQHPQGITAGLDVERYGEPKEEPPPGKLEDWQRLQFQKRENEKPYAEPATISEIQENPALMIANVEQGDEKFMARKREVADEKDINGAPKKFQDKMITLSHWSPAENLKTIDPKKYGTGVSRSSATVSERTRAAYKGFMPRSFHGVEGYKKEDLLSNNMYKSVVDGNKIYDFDKDPMGLYPTDAEMKRSSYGAYDQNARQIKYEKNIVSAGFDGVYSDMHKVVMMFKPTDAEGVAHQGKALPLDTRGKEIKQLEAQIKKQEDYLKTREDAKGTEGYNRLQAKIKSEKATLEKFSVREKGKLPKSFEEAAPYLKRLGWADERIEGMGEKAKENFAKHVAEVRPEKEILPMFKAGEINKGWYRQLKDSFAALTNGNEKRTTLLLKLNAAFSPNRSVALHTGAAFDALSRWEKAGEPKDPEVIKGLFKGIATDASAANAAKVILGERMGTNDMIGNKIRAFLENGTGNLDPVALDIYMSFLYKSSSYEPATGKTNWIFPRDPRYSATALNVMKTAEKLGWKPAEAQAAAWSSVAALSDRIVIHGENPSDAVDNLTYGDIVGEDTASIISREWNREQSYLGKMLREAGVTDKEISGLPHNKIENADQKIIDDMSPKDIATMKRFAEELGGVNKQRALVEASNKIPVTMNFESLSSADKNAEILGKLPYKTQMKMHKDIVESIVPDIQKVAEGLGIKADLAGHAPGSWVEEGALFSNPSSMYHLTGTDGKPLALTKENRSKIEGLCAYVGHVLDQAGMGYTKPMAPKNPMEDQPLAMVTTKEPLTRKEMISLHKAMEKLTDAANFFLAPHEKGVYIVNVGRFSDKLSNTDFHNYVENAVKSTIKDKVGEIKEFDNGGGYVGREEEGQIRGDGYQGKLRDAGGSGLFGDIDTSRERVRGIKEKYAGTSEGKPTEKFSARDVEREEHDDIIKRIGNIETSGVDRGALQEDKGRVVSYFERTAEKEGVQVPEGANLNKDIQEALEDYLYHATYEDKLKDIKAQGLTPEKSAQYIYANDSQKRLFFGTSPDFVSDFGDTILRVKRSDLSPEQLEEIERRGGTEAQYRKVVPSDKLQKLTAKGEWEKFQARDKEPKDTFYSQLSRVVESKLPGSGTAEQFKDIINSWASKGEFKADELKWSGLDDYLKEKQGKVSKQEIVDYLKNNQVEIKEITKGAGKWQGDNLISNGDTVANVIKNDDGTWSYQSDNSEGSDTFKTRREAMDYAEADLFGIYGKDETKFHQYQLPGGENYKELLLTLPEMKSPEHATWMAEVNRLKEKYGDNFYNSGKLTAVEKSNLEILHRSAGSGSGVVYKSNHWDEPNVLAHVRMNDRTDAEGNKVLFLEEVQSDWHQEGRKRGYANPVNKNEINVREDANVYVVYFPDGKAYDVSKKLVSSSEEAISYAKENKEKLNSFNAPAHEQGVPPAPFSKTWPELVMKRMLRHAAENGYDKLAWTTGEQQAEKYKLSTHIESVQWDTTPDGRRVVYLQPKDNSGTIRLLVKDGTVQDATDRRLNSKTLDDVIGKDLAQKIIAEPEAKLSGVALDIGGSGMKGFYDTIIPSFLNKYAKKWGAKVGETQIGNEKAKVSNTGAGWEVFANGESKGNYELKKDAEQRAKEIGIISPTVHSVDITPSMQESVMQGQPLFQAREKLADQFSTPDDKSRIESLLEAPKRLVAPGIEAATDIKKGFQSLALPTAKSPEHLGAAQVLGKALGHFHRDNAQFTKALDIDELMFNKAGVHDPKVPLEQNIGMRFASDVSMGRPLSSAMELVKSKIKNIEGRLLGDLKDVGAELQTVHENYFPGMWTKPSIRAFNQALKEAFDQQIGSPETDITAWDAKQKAWVKARAEELEKAGKGSDNSALSYFSRTPLKGGESFRKQKTFQDTMTAIEFGLKPISNNPIEMEKMKFSEMGRSIMANRAINEFEGKGDIINVGNNGVPLKKSLQAGFNRAEWEKINDKYGTIWHRDEDTGMLVKIGERWAKKPVADILNNYLSSSLYNSPYFGKLYKGYMDAASILNQSQLSVFSAFHVGFTSSDVTISQYAEGIKDLYGLIKGNRTIGNVASSFGKVPLSFIRTPREGAKIIKEYETPTMNIPEDAPVGHYLNSKESCTALIAKAAEMAGGGFHMEQGLKTEWSEKMVQEWYGGQKIKAALRSPVALTELTAKPIMEWLVPRQKAGVFGTLAGRLMEMNPEKTLNELVPELRQAWNRVDARLGQVQYDRLFINNIAKNTMQAVIRAPGWTGGTIAEIGGAFKDTAKFFAEWKRTGKAPDNIPDRVAYTLALATGVAAVNAILTYALTGEQPQGADYWAFRDGSLDEHGRPQRWVLPTYAKDVYAYKEDAGHTLLAKTHPLISLIGDVAKNKDYYGVKITKEEDPIYDKGLDVAKYGLKQFIPFWMRGAGKEAERSGGLLKALETKPQKILAPQLGIMPAPQAYTQSDLEKYMSKFHEQFTRTSEQFDKSKKENELVMALRRGDTDARQKIQDALKAKEISYRNMQDIMRKAHTNPLVGSANSLSLEALAEGLRSHATPEERKVLLPLLRKKFISRVRELTDEQRDKYRKLINDIQDGK